MNSDPYVQEMKLNQTQENDTSLLYSLSLKQQIYDMQTQRCNIIFIVRCPRLWIACFI